MAASAFKSAAHAKADPFLVLAQNILCAPAPTNLTPNQTYALHEFFHEVAADTGVCFQQVLQDGNTGRVGQCFEHLRQPVLLIGKYF